MSQLFYGSICITDIMERLNKKHSAFVKGNNGKIYCNINVWENDIPDQYGNSLSLLLSSKKELKDQEGKQYIGNCKKSEYDGPKPVSDADVSAVGKSWANGFGDASSITEPIDDLPF
jgi:hypothetical protein